MVEIAGAMIMNSRTHAAQQRHQCRSMVYYRRGQKEGNQEEVVVIVIILRILETRGRGGEKSRRENCRHNLLLVLRSTRPIISATRSRCCAAAWLQDSC